MNFTFKKRSKGQLLKEWDFFPMKNDWKRNLKNDGQKAIPSVITLGRSFSFVQIPCLVPLLRRNFNASRAKCTGSLLERYFISGQGNFDNKAVIRLRHLFFFSFQISASSNQEVVSIRIPLILTTQMCATGSEPILFF